MSSYDPNGLGLASFKESGELEYGADSAYLLAPDANGGNAVTLRCLKDRNGESLDIALHFDRHRQRFIVADGGKAPAPDPGKLRAALDFVDFTLAELSRAEIAVWLILYRDTRDGSARTSMRDLARRAGCSPRAVATAVARLEKLGLLKTIHRGGFRRGASRYRVKPLLKYASC